MDDAVAAETTSGSTRHRRNSTTTTTAFLVPTKLTIPTEPHSFPASTATGTTTSASSSTTSSSQSFPPPDFEQFISNIKPSSYTSLRDLLPSSVVAQSPTASSTSTGLSIFEISIRNRLVKHAAWAYLQPMSTETESSSRSFLLRLLDLMKTPIAAFFRLITRSFAWILQTVRVSSR